MGMGIGTTMETEDPPYVSMPWDPPPPPLPIYIDPDPGLRDRILSCSRCELRANCASPVPWSGPTGADILFFGEAPGQNEDKTLIPWSGQAGREFDNYLWRTMLDRLDVRVSNVVRCRPPASGTGTTISHRAACFAWTVAEIDQCQPKLIVAMGAGAVHTFLGEDQSVMDNHGRLFTYNHKGREIPLFVTMNPAAGMRNTREMRNISEDFRKLGDYVRGTFTQVTDPYAGRENYRALETEEEVMQWAADLEQWAEWCRDNGIECSVSADTEWTPDGKIWCATFSYEPGTAVLIWPKHLPLIADLLINIRITLHSAQADIGPLQRAGIPVTTTNLGDTMIAAYLLNYPRGLKTLARTLSGMEMMDYMEVVGPEQRRLEREYCEAALNVEIPEKVKGDRRLTIHGLMKRALADMEKEELGGKEVDVEDRWQSWDEERKRPIVEALGEFPKASLADVLPEKAIFYACRDADGTERTRLELERQLKAFWPWDGGIRG